jgi:transcriptional regulator with XRE-family HTH domain
VVERSVMSDDRLRVVGREVRRLRLAAGLSGVELARRAGVPQPTVSRVETGRRVSDAEVVALFSVLGLEPGELERWADDPPGRQRLRSLAHTPSQSGPSVRRAQPGTFHPSPPPTARTESPAARGSNPQRVTGPGRMAQRKRHRLPVLPSPLPSEPR